MNPIPGQAERGAALRQLHAGPGLFVIPNPWDAGTARLMAASGFKALATTSAGQAFSLGLRDGEVGRARALAHIAELAAATALPLSADLENGWGDDPETVAQSVRLAAAHGAVGASIEDVTGRVDAPVYAPEAAAERIAAAVEAARSLPFPFVLTARADNHVLGRDDLRDTIRRLQAYQQAGADVLFAPGLRHLDDIRAVLSEIDRPLNVMMGLAGVTLSLQDLAAAGVRRVSLGGSLARRALAAVRTALAEIKLAGSFSYASQAIPGADLNKLFSTPFPTGAKPS